MPEGGGAASAVVVNETLAEVRGELFDWTVNVPMSLSPFEAPEGIVWLTVTFAEAPGARLFTLDGETDEAHGEPLVDKV